MPVFITSSLNKLINEIGSVSFWIIYKHSSICPVSIQVERIIFKWLQNHPEVPIYKITVIEDRLLSHEVASWTGVQHESPQVIIGSQKTVITHQSHFAITESWLKQVYEDSIN